MLARVYDVMMKAADRLGLSLRRQRLARGAHGLIIEIGAGTGLEFAHYPPGVHVVAVEPDHAMIARAATQARMSKATISLVIADARALPFRDGVFDTAMSALAFCTIPEPHSAAAEMRRVLRHSGTARLLEHVRARHRALAWPQVVLTPVWRRLAGGCHLDRPTAEVLRDGGFDVTVERSAFDGAVVELTARPSARRRESTGASSQGAFSGHSASVIIV